MLSACTIIICWPLSRIALYDWRSLPELRALSSSSSYYHRVGIYYMESPCQYTALLAAEFTSSICRASNERVGVDALACHACRLHTLLALLPSPRCACASRRHDPHIMLKMKCKKGNSNHSSACYLLSIKPFLYFSLPYVPSLWKASTAQTILMASRRLPSTGLLHIFGLELGIPY